MKLIIVSGRSGSGKSTVLRIFEDSGFFCVDNMPLGLLLAFVEKTLADPSQTQSVAVCIDARSSELGLFVGVYAALGNLEVEKQIIYLDALSPTLVKRFSETRRRHPLTGPETGLSEAIDQEATRLADIADLADLSIDTTLLSDQNLRIQITNRVLERQVVGISILFRSFGFKYGVPVDADFVFDLRCLPNPHWVDRLKPLTGLDDDVQAYLSGEPEVIDMFDDIAAYLGKWLPAIEANSKSYITIALGCTGGQHRSVYMAHQLAVRFSNRYENVLVRHRELARPR